MRSFRRLVTTTATIGVSVMLTLGLALPAGAATAAPTKGAIEAARAGYGRVLVAGWAYDPRASSVPSSLDVVVDGKMASLPFANGSRPDVDRALHITGNHGFWVYAPASLGTHTVCVVARPVANSGSTWSILGCRTLTVAHR